MFKRLFKEFKAILQSCMSYGIGITKLNTSGDISSQSSSFSRAKGKKIPPGNAYFKICLSFNENKNEIHVSDPRSQHLSFLS